MEHFFFIVTVKLGHVSFVTSEMGCVVIIVTIQWGVCILIFTVEIGCAFIVTVEMGPFLLLHLKLIVFLLFQLKWTFFYRYSWNGVCSFPTSCLSASAMLSCGSCSSSCSKRPQFSPMFGWVSGPRITSLTMRGTRTQPVINRGWTSISESTEHSEWDKVSDRNLIRESLQQRDMWFLLDCYVFFLWICWKCTVNSFGFYWQFLVGKLIVLLQRSFINYKRIYKIQKKHILKYCNPPVQWWG